jgi:hypothetical protein
MAEMVQHPYECQCKGHEGGSRTFYAAPPDWFAAKGYNTPKNCPACREWIKAQTDDQSVCACGAKIRIPHKLKISHFKRVGPYEPITECGPCSEGNRPPVAIKTRPRRESRKEQRKDERDETFKTHKQATPLQSRLIIVDTEYYNEQTTRNAHTRSRETRAEHLLHHVPGSPYDWSNPNVSAQLGLDRPKSPTSFADGNHTLDELLSATGGYMGSTDMNQVREYEISSGQLARVTFTGNHDGLELTILKEVDGQYEVITTHDNVTVADIKRKKWYN